MKTEDLRSLARRLLKNRQGQSDMKTIKYLMFGGVLAGAVALFAADDKPVKDDVKEAGQATGRAAKKTGKKVKRGSKKAVNKAAEKTEQGADKVRDKTKNP